MQKPVTPSSMPSKTVIFAWIKQIIPQASTKMKVQDLGDGVIYCRIINHYFPGSVNLNRMNVNPKNQYEYSLNLKLFQNALTLHKITVPFDVGRVSKQKFLQNWGLVNGLYRHLSSNNEDAGAGQDSKSVSYVSAKFTPKRSFESAFSNQQSHKLLQPINYAKPVYNQVPSQATIHFQDNNNQQYVTNTPSYVTSQNTNPHQQQQPIQLPPQHQNLTQNSNIQNMNHANPTNNPSKNPQMTYQHLSQNNFTNQGSFGGFNFGNINMATISQMNNLSQSLNFNNNNNRQALLNRQNTLSQQLNKVFEQTQQQTNKCWSVGKLPSTWQHLSSNATNSRQNSGKYSVNSHIFQNNYNAVIDRVKEILLKNSHDIQKIRQIKMLLNIPFNEDIVKIQEEQNIMVNCTNVSKHTQQSVKKQIQTKSPQLLISTKSSIQGQKQNSEFPQSKGSKTLSNCSQKKGIIGSRSISSLGPAIQTSQKKQTTGLTSKGPPQSSGKKIKNNFFGEGVIFRK